MRRWLETHHRALAAVLLVCGSIGCQGLAPRQPGPRLDTHTGMTVSTASELMVYARTEARYSRAARDYVYLGPLETNRQGLREYYLWVGTATTLDRGFLAPEPQLPVAIYASVRGEPMEFALQRWSVEFSGSSALSTYTTTVELYGELVARVTLDQLRMLAQNEPESIRARLPDGSTRVFARWGDAAAWSGFGPLALARAGAP